jgi:hypothetical protein
MLCWWHTVHTPWPYVSYEWNQWLSSPETQFCGQPRHLFWRKAEAASTTKWGNGVGTCPLKYVVRAVKNCQLHLTGKLNGKYSIPARVDNPFPVDYDPSTNLSDILEPECSSFYQHLISVMRWMVELGRIDIGTKVSMSSSYLACPCKGHLENALHVMGYLRLKHNSW